MKRLLLTALVILGLAANVLAILAQVPQFKGQFTLQNNTNSGDNRSFGKQVVGRVGPCDIDYYQLTVTDVSVADYLKIDINMTSDRVIGDYGSLFVKWKDPKTLPFVPFDFPDDHNFDRYATGFGSNQIEMEITCWFKSGIYILGIAGGFQDYINYNMTIFRRYSPVRVLVPGFRLSIFNETRAIFGGNEFNNQWFAQIPGKGKWPANEKVRYYRFFSVTWDRSNFREGTFMVANISRVQVDYPRFPILRVMYGALPEAFEHAPYPADSSTPCLSVPERQCTDLLGNFIHCNCTPGAVKYVDNRIQNTCALTVSPCRWRYGTWYLSVEYPPRFAGFWPGYVNYTIQADIYAPRLTALTRNVTFKGYVDPNLMAHYRVLVPYSDVNPGDHHFLVHVDNVRGGVIDIFVHQSPGLNDPQEAPPGTNLAGDPLGTGTEACVRAEYMCRTCDACNVVVPKCRFRANYWYIGVASVTVDPSNVDNAPISYTIRANWLTDSPPRRLSAGKAVHRSVGENLYDFYVIDVPETIDTWLFVELYARCEQDEVLISMKHGDIPGEHCYAKPDFWCLTGDGREACSFMMNVCDLEPGPLYISVWGFTGPNTQLEVTDDLGVRSTSYYQVPVEYTLWADFDVARQIESGVSYTHCVNPHQYSHYYIRADTIAEGSYLTVETTNAQPATDGKAVQTFVNYNFLAGVVPCYDHLLNCSNAGNTQVDPRFNRAPVAGNADNQNCLIVVPNCDFRSGVWYVAVLGGGADTSANKCTGNWVATEAPNTPHCYTLTVTIWPAPPVHPLVVGETVTGNVETFLRTNLPYQYDHYKLAAQPVPGTDLVITLTYVQDGFLEGASGTGFLQLFANRENLATNECYRFFATAETGSCSLATIIIPSCEWYNFQWWLSVRGSFGEITSRARYTLRTTLETVQAAQLYDGLSVFSTASVGRYHHYYFDVAPSKEQYLHVDFYTTQASSGSGLTLYMNKDVMAGMNNVALSPSGAAEKYGCFSSFDECSSCSCSRQIEGCLLSAGRYFFSVLQPLELGYASQCQHPLEYTLTVSMRDLMTELTPGVPMTAHLHAPVQAAPGKFNSFIHHYRMQVPTLDTANPGQALVFEVSNVKHGSVTAYINWMDWAGPCHCYKYEGFCRAAGRRDDPCTSNPSTFFSTSVRNWCALRIPYAVLQGKDTTYYYFSVVGNENTSPTDPQYSTYIGYVVEAYIEQPKRIVYDKFMAIGYGPSNTYREMQVPNQLYHHYSIAYNPVFEFNHLIVNVSNVQFGGLDVIFSKNIPGDYGNFWTPIWEPKQVNDVGYTVHPTGYYAPLDYCGNSDHLPCYLCRSLIDLRNVPCRAQVPYCQFLGDGTYYVSVVGITQAAYTEYEITMYLQPTIDLNAVTERNVTHFLGWTNFYRMRGVNADPAPSGQILEVQFYRIRNIREANFYTNSDFYVWLNSGGPAGNNRALDPAGSSTDSSASWCEDHVRTSSRMSQRGDARNVTVWNCDLKRTNAAGQGTWYMTVDPAPVQLALGQLTQQLNYSVQWRVRDTMGTPIDLTSFVNLGDAPANNQVYSLNQKESYRTFYVRVSVDTANNQRRKLVVQTLFTAGSTATDNARVYIQPGDIANPGICNTYSCTWPKSSDSNACFDSHRYQNASCCLRTGTYYITVRQFDLTPVSWRFRLRLITEPSTIDARATSGVNTTVNPLINGTNIAQAWRFIYASGVSGVQGENYHHYRFTVSQSDFTTTNVGLLIYITNVNQRVTNAGAPLYLFVRKGWETGAWRYLRTGTTGNIHLSDLCYTYEYVCNLSDTVSQCGIQLPYCQLSAGSYYLSVFNPDLDLENVNNTAGYRGYDLTIAYEKVTPITLGVSFNTTVTSRIGTYFHYTFSVTQDNLANYFDYYLRIRLFEITTSNAGFVNLYARLGDLAADPRLQDTPSLMKNNVWCLTRDQAQTNCAGVTGCTIDYIPCGGIMTSTLSLVRPAAVPLPYAYPFGDVLGGPEQQNKLKPGTYYVSVYVSDTASFKLRASLEAFDRVTLGKHRVIGTDVGTVTSVPGAVGSHREGTTNMLYQVKRINLNDTWPVLEWFQVNLPTDAASLSPNSYMHVRLEDVSGRSNSVATVQLDMFRNDCASWYSCDTGNAGFNVDNLPNGDAYYNCPTGNDADLVNGQCSQPPSATGRFAQTGWCAIDAIGLSPCTFAAETAYFNQYRFRVFNPSRANFTLSVWVNTTTVTPLLNGQNYTSILYRWQYEHFSFNVANRFGSKNRCTVRVDLSAICGSVEGFLNRGSVAGPSILTNYDGTHPYTRANPNGANSALNPPYFNNYHWYSNAEESYRTCALAYCQTVYTSYNSRPRRDTCTMFLDTCQVNPGQYTLAVRGVSQEFPTWAGNKRIVLPAKFIVTPTVTCVDTDELAWMGCDHTVSWTSPCRVDSMRRYPNEPKVNIGGACRDPNFVAHQYYIDVVTRNVGSWLRFGLSIPAEAVARRGFITLSRNRTVSYTGDLGGCPNFDSCRADQGAPCYIVIPTSKVQTGRWYIWADAPRGSRIFVERWEPYIPFLMPEWPYTSTINGPKDSISFSVRQGTAKFPFHRNVQHYRMVLDSGNTPKNMNFWLRLKIRNVVGGTVIGHLNTGLEPYYDDAANQVAWTEANTYWRPVMYAKTAGCTATSGPAACTASVDPCPASWQRLSQWFITIEGSQADSEKMAIQYTFEVLSIVQDTPLHTWESKCIWIGPQALQHYYVAPQIGNDPVFHTSGGVNVPRIARNHTILSIWVQDDVTNPSANPDGLRLYLNDGEYMTNHIATPTCANYGTAQTSRPTGNFANYWQSMWTEDSFIPASPSFIWEYYSLVASAQSRYNAYENVCQFRELKVAVHNPSTVGRWYCIEPRLHTVPINRLTTAIPFSSETLHPTLMPARDFFLLEVPDTTVEADSWLWVELGAVGAAKVYVNKGSLAGPRCSDTSSCRTAGDSPLLSEYPEHVGVCYAHDFCNFKNGPYYLSVISTEWYYLLAEVVTDVSSIALNQQTALQTLPRGQYRYYKVALTEADIPKDAYLQVDIDEVNYGGVRGAIRFTGKPGFYYDSQGPRRATQPNCFEGVEDPVNVDWHEATSGSSGSNVLGNPKQAWLDIGSAPFYARVSTNVVDRIYSANVIRYSHCQLDPGTYYVQIYAHYGSVIQHGPLDLESGLDYWGQTTPIDFPDKTYLPVQFKLTPRIIRYGVSINALTLSVPITGSLKSADTLFFKVTGQATSPWAFARVRLTDVFFGRLLLRGKRNYLASPSLTYGGVCQDCSPIESIPTYTLNPGMVSDDCYFCSNNDISNWPPTSADRSYFSSFSSCEFWIDTCDWDPTNSTTKDWYFSVTAAKTYWIDRWTDTATNFSLVIDEFDDFTTIQQDNDLQVVTGNFTNENWSTDFYKATASCIESSRIAIKVTSGSGVLVDVRDSPCKHAAQYHVQIWCDYDYTLDGHAYICDISIPTRASHPLTTLTYYITVHGSNAAYQLSWRTGLQNCDVPTGLQFCSGIVDYPVWQPPSSKWNYLDTEAACYFDDLYSYFCDQPAYQDVTPECNATLRRFACYESFRRCDDNGFQVGTCRIACDSVEYFCVNKFETVSLPHFSCRSDRYIDHVSETCTGHREEVVFPPGAFPKTPGLTLLESSAFWISPGFLLVSLLILLQLVML